MRSVNVFKTLALALVLSSQIPVDARAATGVCGVPRSDAAPPTTADALFILRVSVELEDCDLCECDVDSSGQIVTTDALIDLQKAVELPVTLNCPACPPPDLECPGVVQFALFAKIRGLCTTNSDCAAFSVCDNSIGRCRTATESDTGWTGLGHDADLNDPVPARLFLDCDGPAPCGECTVSGHDPSLGNCRCADDNRQPCFTVAGPDEQFCGGGQCICNFGPPLPLLAGGVPICVLNTLAGQPEGDVNVDQGSGNVVLHLAEKVYNGISRLQPCPLCVNDPTPADGMRGGVCVGGANNTQSCDAQAYNATFPPPTGALLSLDCFPLPDANVTGSGLSIETVLTTGRSELHALVPCGEGELAEIKCPCRVCSGDPSRPCNEDADCAAVEAGTCSSNGSGVQTVPNACEDLVCMDIGGEEGECSTGPDISFCDALLRPDGTGLISCQANEDCLPVNIGVDAGECTLVQRTPCFLDPIVTQGAPHPLVPLVGGTFCSPPTLSSSVNISAGFPGPGRLTLQTLATLYCKSDPEEIYTPGVGGCPP